MALLKLIGVEHLPAGVALGGVNTCYGLAWSDLGATSFWNASLASYPNVGHLRVEGSNLAFGSVPGSVSQGAGMTTIPFANLIGSNSPNRLFIGFRLAKLVSPPASMPIFAIGTLPSASASSGTNGTGLLMFNTGDTLESAYYEIELNFGAQTYNITKNGNAFVASTALPAGFTSANIKNMYWTIGRYDAYNTPAGTVTLFTLSDIAIITDDVQGSNAVVGRMGDILVKRVPAVSVTGTWTASDGGQVIDKINARRTAGTMQAPDILSPSDLSALRVKLNTTPFAGLPLKGLSISATPLKDGGTSGGLTGKVSKGGVDSTAKVLTVVASSAPPDQAMGVFTTFPDGSTFDITGLAALEVVFTPT